MRGASVLLTSAKRLLSYSETAPRFLADLSLFQAVPAINTAGVFHGTSIQGPFRREEAGGLLSPGGLRMAISVRHAPATPPERVKPWMGPDRTEERMVGYPRTRLVAALLTGNAEMCRNFALQLLP